MGLYTVDMGRFFHISYTYVKMLKKQNEILPKKERGILLNMYSCQGRLKYFLLWVGVGGKKKSSSISYSVKVI